MAGGVRGREALRPGVKEGIGRTEFAPGDGGNQRSNAGIVFRCWSGTVIIEGDLLTDDFVIRYYRVKKPGGRPNPTHIVEHIQVLNGRSFPGPILREPAAWFRSFPIVASLDEKPHMTSTSSSVVPVVPPQSPSHPVPCSRRGCGCAVAHRWLSDPCTPFPGSEDPTSDTTAFRRLVEQVRIAETSTDVKKMGFEDTRDLTFL